MTVVFPPTLDNNTLMTRVEDLERMIGTKCVGIATYPAGIHVTWTCHIVMTPDLHRYLEVRALYTY